MAFPPVAYQYHLWAVSMAVTTGLLRSCFRFVPDVRLLWRDMTTGALVTAVLFSIGQQVIGLVTRTGLRRCYEHRSESQFDRDISFLDAWGASCIESEIRRSNGTARLLADADQRHVD